jgi:glycosyltransferase involved in cell wall biosynthesis
MTSRPLISVIVATYNRYSRLMAALDSVRRQTYRNLEIIVVNDGSCEPAYHGGKRPADVKWIDLPQNTRQSHGFPCLGYVRNVGVAQASGEYLALLDDDDIWLPEKTEKQIACMHGTDIRMSCTEIYAGDGPPRDYLAYPRYYRDWVGIELPENLVHEHVDRVNYITHSAAILHRSLFEEAGPYLEIPLNGWMVEGRMVVEDWELWRNCLKYSPCRYLPEPLVYYDCRFGFLQKREIRARIAALRIARFLSRNPKKIPAPY